MKKIVILLIITMLVFPVVVNAQPAPPLTDIQFLAVTSDGNNYEWEYVLDKWSPDLPLYGDQGYFAIFIEGYYNQNTLRLYNYGNDITYLTYHALPREPLTDSGGIIWGYIVYLGFPLDNVNSGNFTIQAMSLVHPYNTLSDTLVGVQINP